MQRIRRTALATTILASACVLSGPIADAHDAAFIVRSINLSSGGLAEVVGSKQINGSGQIELEVPVTQVDDILKSLIVIDPKGTVSGVTLGGPSATEETFKKLPFSAGDLGDLVRFANALQGIRVRVTRPNETPIEGEILGVSVSNGKKEETSKTLSILVDGTVRTANLADGVSLEILDPVMKQKVNDAVAAVRKAKTDGARSVSIGVSGPTSRDVEVSYVVPSSVWKTTFRMICDPATGKARIQAWAVIENTTGVEWKNVALSLSSGSPVALKQRLHQHYWRDRKELPIGDGLPESRPVPMPQVYANRNISSQQGLDSSTQMAPQAPTMAKMARAGGVAEMAAPEAFIEAQQGDVNVSYVLPHPITLAAGDTFSFPIIDTEMKAERVSLYRSGMGKHPRAAIKMTNSTGATLPPGIVTLYDKKDGYIGDGSIPTLQAGGNELLAFAADNKVDVLETEKPISSLTRISISDGILRSTVTSTIETEYRIKGAPDSDRTILVEHPERPGWTTKADADVSHLGSNFQLTKKVPAGRDVAITVVDETTNSSTIHLLEADDVSLRQFASLAGENGVSQKLERVISAKATLESAKRELQATEQSAKRLADDQARIRENLKAVPEKSEASTIYTKKLMEAEEALTKVEAARSKAKIVVDERQEALRILVRNL